MNESKPLPEFELIDAGEQRADGPLGQLAAVVLDLGGEDGARLRVELHAPVHAVVVLGVPLVERLDVQEVLLVVGAGGDGVDLRAQYEVDAAAQVPLAVLVGNRGHLVLVALDERIRVGELVAFLVLFVCLWPFLFAIDSTISRSRMNGSLPCKELAATGCG